MTGTRPMTRRRVICEAALYVTAIGVAGLPKPAHGNGVEDVFGAGARAKAMGSAGTALATDFSAAYYNPGGIGFCTASTTAVELSRISYDLQLRSDEESTPPPDELRTRDSVTVGLCVPLPFNLSFGLLFNFGMQRPQYFEQTTVSAEPQFVMYGQRLEQMSIMPAAAWRPFDQLAIGACLSALIHSTLMLDNDIPVVNSTKQVENGYSWGLAPSLAPYGGVHYAPLSNLHFGLSYRSVLYHKVKAIAITRVEMAGVPMTLEHLFESVTWYSPEQAAAGVAYAGDSGLSVAADVTWYRWSAYPGPSIHPSAGTESVFAKSLNYPQDEPPDFNDVLVPRVGVEYLWRELLAARVGYGYHGSPAPKPSGVANVLDASAHFVSLGAGLLWKRQRAQLYSHAAARSEDRDFVVKADLFATVGHMPEQSVEKDRPQSVLNAYSFGGIVYDVGLGLAAEF